MPGNAAVHWPKTLVTSPTKRVPRNYLPGIEEGDVIDVCGVSPRELETESVPMETVRQHKEGIIVGVRQNVKFIVSPFQ